MSASDRDERALIARARSDAARCFARACSDLRVSVASQADPAGVVRRHPLIATGGAALAGCVAAIAAMRWWRRPARPASPAGAAAATAPRRPGLLAALVVDVAVPFLLDRVISARPAATPDAPARAPTDPP